MYDKLHQRSYKSLFNQTHLSFVHVTPVCAFVSLMEGDVCLCFLWLFFAVACPYASYYKTQNAQSRPGYSLASNK